MRGEREEEHEIAGCSTDKCPASVDSDARGMAAEPRQGANRTRPSEEEQKRRSAAERNRCKREKRWTRLDLPSEKRQGKDDQCAEQHPGGDAVGSDESPR